MSSWKKPALMAVSALTAFAVSACGVTSGASEAPKQPSVLELLASDLKGSLLKAAEATDKTDSVTVTMTGTMAGEKISVQGLLDLGDPLKAEMKMTNSKGATTVRMIGAVIFTEIPAENRAGTGGKRWMKMDLTGLSEMAGSGFAKQFEDVDPVKQVKTLLAIDGTTVVGQETVNGVPTVHYTVTTPVATYLKQIDAMRRDTTEQTLAAQGVKELTIDLWVDEQYRPRRAGLVMGTMGDMVIDYTDYDKTVTIETPPPAETADFAEMLKGLTADI
ncbi:hypothetical protein [Micromonospora ureilytica]|uniref:LppX_LprAFG lipoprotein n=1 Tax=Micromonospora ureilytica TaxID=709868 RepID=A0ABS0JKA1_9ACTN|nr:hypothetical protein [Micromonospora ureilytica]MBG6067491.1 hypothetical protein [Micromonospora ureilytica]WSR59049.1 hypothetical protein OG400_13015 [Micromonospora ureilytica]